MAYDLAHTPVTRIQVQACGDGHLLNFGLFATPERNLIFDINDFDETLPAPWEWDLKRLTTSFVVAARLNGISDERSREIAVACGRSYRKHLGEFSEMSPLDVWYYCVSSEDLIGIAPDDKARSRQKKMAAKAQGRVGESLFPKITEERDGQHHFIEQPHVMSRVTDEQSLHQVAEGIESYRESLPDERRFLFDRYRLEDFALRVVGVGSVGTRCFVGLFFCDDKNPLLLQAKEAGRSVLEPYAGKSPCENQGQRVVVGQRLTQAASDILLGWVRTGTGRDFYVRQLRDMKFSMPVQAFDAGRLEHYAEVCGWTLARAHATSGDPAVISGYLGRSDKSGSLKRCQDSFFLFGGRPRGRSVDSSPSRAAIATIQSSLPNGLPHAMQRRTAVSSLSLCGALTRCTQFGQRAIGQAVSSTGCGSGCCNHRHNEPHGHCSARCTNPARNALRST